VNSEVSGTVENRKGKAEVREESAAYAPRQRCIGQISSERSAIRDILVIGRKSTVHFAVIKHTSRPYASIK